MTKQDMIIQLKVLKTHLEAPPAGSFDFKYNFYLKPRFKRKEMTECTLFDVFTAYFRRSFQTIPIKKIPVYCNVSGQPHER
jgi:hypothetical protein